jgi:hypothetical protein
MDRAKVPESIEEGDEILTPFDWSQGEVDPLGGTTGTGFLVGSSAVPIA